MVDQTIIPICRWFDERIMQNNQDDHGSQYHFEVGRTKKSLPL